MFIILICSLGIEILISLICRFTNLVSRGAYLNSLYALSSIFFVLAKYGPDRLALAKIKNNTERTSCRPKTLNKDHTQLFKKLLIRKTPSALSIRIVLKIKKKPTPSIRIALRHRAPSFLMSSPMTSRYILARSFKGANNMLKNW